MIDYKWNVSGAFAKGLQMSPETDVFLKKLSSKIPPSVNTVRVRDNVIFGKGEYVGEDEIRFLRENNKDPTYAIKYKKIIIKNCMFTTGDFNLKGKRDNSYVQLKNLSYGRVKNIVITDDNECFIILERLIVYPIEFSPGEVFTYLKEVDVRPVNNYLLITPEDVREKCVFFRVGNDKAYISQVIAKHEVQ